MAPKVLVTTLTVRLMVLTRSFIARPACCADVAKRDVRNIAKQKSFAGCPESPTKVHMAMASPNILVVEDDRETRALIAKYLRTNACNVTTATDGREMVRAMTDHRVDLLILDVMLPGEDGLSLCRKVRAESQMPIIMLTARGEDVDRIVGPRNGRGRLSCQSRSTRANCWPGSTRCCAARRPPRRSAPPTARPPSPFWDGGSISGCASCATRRARGLR